MVRADFVCSQFTEIWFLEKESTERLIIVLLPHGSDNGFKFRIIRL